MNVRSWLEQAVLGRVGELVQSLGRKRHPSAPQGTGPEGTGQPAVSEKSIIERLRTMRHELEQATVRLGFIGESGSGKSSLINAIVGKPVAAVGALVETTRGPQEVPVDGLVLVDLPGCGTPRWPRETYVERLGLLDGYDGFVLVTASRLKECDATLFAELARKAKKPFFVVRSHFDLAASAHGEDEARSVIAPYVRELLKAPADLPVYMVSSVSEPHYDLEKLILDIRAALPEWKRVRFIMAAGAYGEETLRSKREAAEKVVAIHAGLAAANALNPIPGLDVGVDLGLLMTMARYVISTYGFTPEQVEALRKKARVRAAVVRGLQEAAERFAPYLTRAFLARALGCMGADAAVKYSAKWVPLAGTLVSAGVGYKLTYAFGEKLIDECESAARQIVHDLAGEHAAPR
jgi:predicted GTPase